MPEDITSPGKRKYSGILSASIVSFSMNSTLRFFIPVLIPLLVSTLHITVYMGSLLITAYWVGYTLFQIPAGIISDRVGVSKVAKISFILMAFSFFLFHFPGYETANRRCNKPPGRRNPCI